jgi:hypothetical protein
MCLCLFFIYLLFLYVLTTLCLLFWFIFFFSLCLPLCVYVCVCVSSLLLSSSFVYISFAKVLCPFPKSFPFSISLFPPLLLISHIPSFPFFICVSPCPFYVSLYHLSYFLNYLCLYVSIFSSVSLSHFSPSLFYLLSLYIPFIYSPTKHTHIGKVKKFSSDSSTLPQPG